MKGTIYILFAAVLLLSCGAREIKDARKILDNVESFIQERPDSALSVLEGIDKSNLNNKELKARHGLLLSMALDKNFIDLTSDSLIAPVVKYYEGTKDYDHLFKAYYYLGRIYHNADRHNESMMIYSKALDISDKISDNLYIGLLHAQFGHLNYDYFNYEAAFFRDFRVRPSAGLVCCFCIYGATAPMSQVIPSLRRCSLSGEWLWQSCQS